MPIYIHTVYALYTFSLGCPSVCPDPDHDVSTSSYYHVCSSENEVPLKSVWASSILGSDWPGTSAPLTSSSPSDLLRSSTLSCFPPSVSFVSLLVDELAIEEPARPIFLLAFITV